MHIRRIVKRKYLLALLPILLPLSWVIRGAMLPEADQSKYDLAHAAAELKKKLLATAELKKDEEKIHGILEQKQGVKQAYEGTLVPQKSMFVSIKRLEERAQPEQKKSKKTLITVYDSRINPMKIYKDFPQFTISSDAKKELIEYIHNGRIEVKPLLDKNKAEFITYSITSDGNEYLLQPVAAWLLEYAATIKRARKAYSRPAKLGSEELDRLLPSFSELTAMVNKLNTVDYPNTTAAVIFDLGNDSTKTSFTFIASERDAVTEGDPIAPYSTLFNIISQYYHAKHPISTDKMNTMIGSLENPLFVNIQPLKLSAKMHKKLRARLRNLHPSSSASVEEEPDLAPVVPEEEPQQGGLGEIMLNENQILTVIANATKDSDLSILPPAVQALVPPLVEIKAQVEDNKYHGTAYHNLLSQAADSYARYISAYIGTLGRHIRAEERLINIPVPK